MSIPDQEVGTILFCWLIGVIAGVLLGLSAAVLIARRTKVEASPPKG